MKTSLSREVKILGLAAFFLFLGFDGVQEYITSFFSESGLIEGGFKSLILIYLFFVIFDPIASNFVSRFGAKKCILFGSLFYPLFILSLLSKSIWVIYLASALLGMAAAFFWIGQNSMLIRTSKRESYGATCGFFNFSHMLGSSLGVVTLGILIQEIGFNNSFFLFSLFPLVGFFLLLNLKDIRVDKKVNRSKLLTRPVFSKTILRLASIPFVFNFTFGLVIGIIPLQIKEVLGISYVGVLTSLFFILPVLISYLSGKVSDVTGREKAIIFSYSVLLSGLVLLYFFSYQPFFLAVGIILLALNWAIMRPLVLALVGDVSTEKNLEPVVALFWLVGVMGIVAALGVSHFVLTFNLVYFISIILGIVSFILVFPLFKLGVEELRKKISLETSKFL